MRMAQILVFKDTYGYTNYGWTFAGIYYGDGDGHASTKITIAFIGRKKLTQILRPADLEHQATASKQVLDYRR